jgi:ankyrin repeat protein
MFIERGADVTAQNNDGSTPLNPATRKGRVDVARLFIERGMDVTAQNNNKETLLLHPASTLSYFTRMFRAKYAELARIFLKYGIDVNAQNKNVLTPLRLAHQGRLAEIERILFQHGADFGAHDNMN